MHVTYFTIAMSVLWSSVVFLIFYLLRRKNIVLEVCSVSGIVALYLFCMIRLFVPLEFPWTRMIYGGKWFNQFNDFVQTQVTLFSMKITIIQLLFFVWGIGAVAGILSCFIRYFCLVRLLKKLPKCEDDTVNEVLHEIMIGEKRIPEIMKTDLFSVPCCFGVWKKRIMLPMKEYPKETLQYILRHECTHLKCQDTVVNLLTSALCACYWWNPLVYLLKHDLNQSMELRCDRMVVRNIGDEKRGAYLDVLLTEYKNTYKKEKSKWNYHLASQLFERHTENMVERFRTLGTWKSTNQRTGKILTCVLGAFVLLASYSVTLQSRFDCPMEEIEKDSNAVAVDVGDVYLLECSDGTYIFCTEYGENEIKKEFVEMVLQSGVPLRKENE